MQPTILFDELEIGDAIQPLDVALTATMIVAGALASRDFMPVHHDKDFAVSQGAPDIFMNILTTNGYIARFLNDWTGPGARVGNIRIRLGVPAVPGQILRFRGEILRLEKCDSGSEVEVSVQVKNELGDHATGTAMVVL
jgi:acyl dehydratase